MTRRTDQVPDNTAYVYDRANRLTQRTYPDALNDTFTYDQASRLLTASSARYNNVVTRVYDDASRLTSETLTVGGQNFPVQSAFDAANRRTSITYPDGKVVAQAFTDRNQLSNVSYDGSNVATLAYDIGMRQTTKTFVNGKVETRTYRLDNRLTQIQTPGVTDFTFTYDANKNPLTKNFALDTSDNQTYTYDAEDRLTNFARQSGFNQNWTLSLVGDWSAFNNNGSAETRTHNNVHELTAINAGSLAYDLKGNLTSNSNGQTHTWDFENLMKTATVGADTANYEYDAFRRRVKKSFQGASTVFVYDGWRCVTEYENGASASSPARDFVFATYLDEPLMMVTAPAGAATKRYYHSDHLYSIYALTDAAGTVVERYRYEAYGKATVLTAAFAPKANPNYSQYANPFTFTGQRLDAETGLGYWKNRYFSYDLGRWISRDLVGYSAGSAGLYEFVGSRATEYLDPLGLERFDYPDPDNIPTPGRNIADIDIDVEPHNLCVDAKYLPAGATQEVIVRMTVNVHAGGGIGWTNFGNIAGDIATVEVDGAVVPWATSGPSVPATTVNSIERHYPQPSCPQGQHGSTRIVIRDRTRGSRIAQIYDVVWDYECQSGTLACASGDCILRNWRASVTRVYSNTVRPGVGLPPGVGP